MFNNERFFVWGKQRRIPRYLHYKSIRLHKINISAIHLEQYIMLNSCTRFQSMYLQYTSHLQSTVYYDYAWFTKKLQIHDVTQKNFPHFLPFPIYVSEYFQCKICTRGTRTHYLNISLVFVLVIICCFLTQTVQKSEKNCKNRKFSSTINYF